MPSWKKVVVSGSHAELSSVTGSFTGSFKGVVENTIASSSTALTAGTASVATRANTLAPTATASIADRATTASFADLAGTIRSGLTASHADRATSASISDLASTLSSTATASFANISTLSRGGSGSFSGSFQGDGSGLTGVSVTADPGYSNDITLTSDFTTNVNTYNSLYGPLTVGAGTTVTVSVGSFLKVEDFW